MRATSVRSAKHVNKEKITFCRRYILSEAVHKLVNKYTNGRYHESCRPNVSVISCCSLPFFLECYDVQFPLPKKGLEYTCKTRARAGVNVLCKFCKSERNLDVSSEDLD